MVKADCRVPVQGFGNELLTKCLAMIAGLLADDVYFARREGGRLATVLYRKWAQPQVSYPALSWSCSLELSPCQAYKTVRFLEPFLTPTAEHK